MRLHQLHSNNRCTDSQHVTRRKHRVIQHNITSTNITNPNSITKHSSVPRNSVITRHRYTTKLRQITNSVEQVHQINRRHLRRQPRTVLQIRVMRHHLPQFQAKRQPRCRGPQFAIPRQTRPVLRVLTRVPRYALPTGRYSNLHPSPPNDRVNNGTRSTHPYVQQILYERHCLQLIATTIRNYYRSVITIMEDRYHFRFNIVYFT